MKHLMAAMLAAVLSLAGTAQTQCVDLKADLRQLDEAVANHETYDRQKTDNIKLLKKETDACFTAQDQYNYYRQLLEAYQKFNADSSEYYLQRCYAVAKDAQLGKLYVLTQIEHAHIVITQGDLIAAQRIIDSIPPIGSLDRDAQIKMAITMMEYNIRVFIKNINENRNPAKQALQDAWNRYSHYLPDGMWQKAYYESYLTQTDMLPALEREIKRTAQPSLKAAMLYVAMALQCHKHGDTAHYLHYLILSAINDIKSSNHEASSLLYLVNEKDIDLGLERAYRYTMLCTENINGFKDQGRSFDLTRAHSAVTEAYQQVLRNYCRACIAVIVLLIVAVVAIVCLLVSVVKKRRRQAQLLEQVEKINNQLTGSIAREREALQKLKDSNALLQHEIDYHNRNFIDVYQLLTKYIADVQAFKKSMYNLITAGKADKVRHELGNNANTEKYLKSFFEQFDKAFLATHPDFIKRFNSLLRDDCHIESPVEGTLTPELRIYALVAIGITDSVSIAEFLHYSTQTIYNYRLRVRHCARIPEKTFADAVAHLYSDGNEPQATES